MPPGTSIDHVEDHVVLVKEDVTLDLLVELVADLDVGCVSWSRLVPFSTNVTCLAYFWNKGHNKVTYSDSLQKTSHSMFRGVKPSDM